jgi:hypothetical protein
MIAGSVSFTISVRMAAGLGQIAFSAMQYIHAKT